MANLGTFDIGDEVQVTATFTDLDGDLTTPGAYTFQVQQPDGTEVSYDENDVETDNPSTGVVTLTFTITANDPGRWYVRARGTAGLKAADEDWFYVKPSAFATP